MENQEKYPNFGQNMDAVMVWIYINQKIQAEMESDKDFLNKKFREMKKTFREAGLKNAAKSGTAFAVSQIPGIGPLLGKAIRLIPTDEKNDGKELTMASYYVDRIEEHVKKYDSNAKAPKKVDEFKNILINIIRASLELAVAEATLKQLKDSIDANFQKLIDFMKSDADKNMREGLPEKVDIELQ